MSKQTEAMKLALEALVKTDAEPGSKAWEREAEAITALRVALASQGEALAEPDYRAMYLKIRDEVARLQKRKWVGLTEDEIDDIEATWEATQEWVSFSHAARVIEAKLKEKNT